VTFCCQLNQVSLCAMEEGLRWKYRYNRSQEEYWSRIEGAVQGGSLCAQGNLCIKHLQQLLLIVGRAYAYKCYSPMVFSPHQQYRVWQVCSIIKAQTRLRQETLMAFACGARTMPRTQPGHVVPSPGPWGCTEIKFGSSEILGWFLRTK